MDNTEPVVEECHAIVAARYSFSPHQVTNCARDIAELCHSAVTAALARREAEIVEILEQRQAMYEGSKDYEDSRCWTEIETIIDQLQNVGGA